MRATGGLSTGGVMVAGSRSSRRKSVLNPKTLGTCLPTGRLSPVPIFRNRALFYIKYVFFELY
ncbi:MAG: hypothetical protein COU07_01010 [Candidatus Harrisonbacteria bacterium CG10_big_fil_rev_8_21_14_0_10_40_38]|uniref:Uncharacterized protein n=1 Tax=Candidatus Harrisonbacteria bacterium CG10_big_fil_rev_8_21_14_0_10_40_38 TaxID=1974583 RepID=A0A2H0USS5_9BACT|nr:MAG: hypothetical protein COU07_01010 [Candidatus Harrisonbacteria bacterium CG10_big_fil_rev_8_21_14_0_10_40_38]